jgi:hypothetical protein
VRRTPAAEAHASPNDGAATDDAAYDDGGNDEAFEPTTVGFRDPPTHVDQEIRDVLDAIEKERVNTSPAYQRNPCWKYGQKQRLIDSVMNNFFIPPLVMYVDAEVTRYDHECIDGQNRLLALLSFVRSEKVPDGRPGRSATEPRSMGFITWDHYEGDERVHSVYTLTDEVRQWGDRRGFTVREFTPKQRRKFDTRHVMTFRLGGRIPLALRQDQFRRLQGGTEISFSDRARNNDNAFCRMVVARRWGRPDGPAAPAAVAAMLSSPVSSWLQLLARCALVAAGRASGSGVHALVAERPLRRWLETAAADAAADDALLLDSTVAAAAAGVVEAFIDTVGAVLHGAKPLHLLALLDAYTRAPEDRRKCFARADVLTAVVKHKEAARGVAACPPALLQTYADAALAAALRPLPRTPPPTLAAVAKEPARGRTSLPQAVRVECWNRHVGRDAGVADCFCCGVEKVYALAFEAGHVVARAAGGGDDADNLRPLCGGCNRAMGAESMESYCRRHHAARSPFIAALAAATA